MQTRMQPTKSQIVNRVITYPSPAKIAFVEIPLMLPIFAMDFVSNLYGLSTMPKSNKSFEF